MNVATVGLCAGRHEIKTNDGQPVEQFIFQEIENPLDFEYLRSVSIAFNAALDVFGADVLHLYVTGLTSALTAFLAVCSTPDSVILMHFNRETGKYEPQVFY